MLLPPDDLFIRQETYPWLFVHGNVRNKMFSDTVKSVPVRGKPIHILYYLWGLYIYTLLLNGLNWHSPALIRVDLWIFVFQHPLALFLMYEYITLYSSLSPTISGGGDPSLNCSSQGFIKSFLKWVFLGVFSCLPWGLRLVEGQFYRCMWSPLWHCL